MTERRRIDPLAAREARTGRTFGVVDPARRRTGKLPGKPRIEFDYDEVEALAANGLSQAQIADALAVSQRTITDRVAHDAEFAEAMRQGKHRMRRTIANGLFRAARKGDMRALIFLAKVHLDWKEEAPPPSQLSPQQMAELLRSELGRLGTDAPPQ